MNIWGCDDICTYSWFDTIDSAFSVKSWMAMYIALYGYVCKLFVKCYVQCSANICSFVWQNMLCFMTLCEALWQYMQHCVTEYAVCFYDNECSSLLIYIMQCCVPEYAVFYDNVCSTLPIYAVLCDRICCVLWYCEQFSANICNIVCQNMLCFINDIMWNTLDNICSIMCQNMCYMTLCKVLCVCIWHYCVLSNYSVIHCTVCQEIQNCMYQTKYAMLCSNWYSYMLT